MNDSSSQGNPNIGMEADSLEAAEQLQDTSVGSEDFFNELENQVNGGIQDNTEATQSQDSGSEQVTHAQEDVGSNNVAEPSKEEMVSLKRYKDSSREAVRWRDKYKQVEQFVPVLEAMKNDSGLVDHVRDYLQGGGQPSKSIQEQLGLDEDFMFDQQEAMSNPDSDSAKLMNAHVDKMVQGRVGQMLTAEKQRANEAQSALIRKREEAEFKQKHNMSDEQFESFKEKAKSIDMTLDRVYTLVNLQENNKNVAQSTKQDMLNQMRNVQNMPSSASGANSQGGNDASPDREVFDKILGFNSKTDNIFG